MERHVLCKICLVGDIRMKLLTETCLQDMYESLISTVCDTRDNQPIQICYICYAKLQNCFQLRKLCRRSKELFTILLSSNTLSSTALGDISCTTRLRITAPLLLSMGYEEQKTTGCDVKLESRKVVHYVEIKGEEAIEHTQPLEDPIHTEDSAQTSELVEDVCFSVPKEEMTGITSSADILQETKSIMLRGPRVSRALEDGVILINNQCINCNHITSDIDDKRKGKCQRTPSRHNETCSCDTCQRLLNNCNSLSTHVRTHTDEKLYQCKICKRSFKRIGNFNAHIRTHSEGKPYQCNICNRNFRRKSHLNDHTRIHSNEKPYQCNMCCKSFDRNSHLNSHICTHADEKPYQCTICKKKFKQKSTLNIHTLIHTGEKPYQCDTCNKKFNQKSHLNSHIRLHTGEKPYQCKICEQCFIRSDDLNTHIRTHTGDKPYQCNVCNKKFIRKSHLISHVRTHAVEKPM